MIIKMKKFINKLSKAEKVTYSILIMCLILVVSIGIPTLARLVDSSGMAEMDVWDGSVAISYASGSGIESDPYIISDGAEFAYFSEQLASNNYANTYFQLSGNIILNAGIFDYDTSNGIMYILDDVTYYVSPFNNTYYATAARTGSPEGTINIFPTLPNFQGTLDGRSYTVYGGYITDSSAYELGLFTNLQGTIKNLQIANGMV